MMHQNDLSFNAITLVMAEKEKTDRMACLGAAAFVPFAAGIIFSEPFIGQPIPVKGVYVAHIFALVIAAAAAFACLQSQHMSRGLMILEASLADYEKATDSERVTRLLKAAESFTAKTKYFRWLYLSSASIALLLGLFTYALSALWKLP